MRVFRIGTFSYIIFGFVSLVSLFVGVSLYTEGQIALSILFSAAGVWMFIYFCFQKLVFEDDVMSFRRPFSKAQSISLRNITRATIALTNKNGKLEWKCLMLDGDKVLLKFNPKPYSFTAIDYMFDQISFYSPHCVVEDGTKAFRSK